jgi:hypothetical protein
MSRKTIYNGNKYNITPNKGSKKHAYIYINIYYRLIIRNKQVAWAKKPAKN